LNFLKNDVINIDINYKLKKIQLNEQDSTTYDFTDTLGLKQYCKQTNNEYVIFHSIIQLLIDNGFLYIGRAGPGDCISCSNEIIFKKDKSKVYSFIRKDLKDSCMPNDCYWNDYVTNHWTTDKKGKIKIITHDILLVRKPLAK
jgi:hypothetical protein